MVTEPKALKSKWDINAVYCRQMSNFASKKTIYQNNCTTFPRNLQVFFYNLYKYI